MVFWSYALGRFKLLFFFASDVDLYTNGTNCKITNHAKQSIKQELLGDAAAFFILSLFIYL